VVFGINRGAGKSEEHGECVKYQIVGGGLKLSQARPVSNSHATDRPAHLLARRRATRRWCRPRAAKRFTRSWRCTTSDVVAPLAMRYLPLWIAAVRPRRPAAWACGSCRMLFAISAQPRAGREYGSQVVLCANRGVSGLCGRFALAIALGQSVTRAAGGSAKHHRIRAGWRLAGPAGGAWCGATHRRT